MNNSENPISNPSQPSVTLGPQKRGLARAGLKLGWKIPAALAFLFILVAALSYYGWRFVNPIGSQETIARWELRRAGAKDLWVGEAHAYVREHCSTDLRKGVDPSLCTCVALVHGLGDTGLTWKRVLEQPAKEWKSGVRLYAWDLQGAGLTPAPARAVGERVRAAYEVRAQAKALSETLRGVPECRRWLVVGNSLGGWISAWLAIDHPELVFKLMLVDSAGIKSSAIGVSELLTNPTVESLKEFQRRAYAKPKEHPGWVWDAALRNVVGSNARDVRAAQTPASFLENQIESLKQPTLILWGAADRVTPPADAEKFKGLIPSAQLHVAQNCGHLPQKECVSEFVAALNGLLMFGSM